MFDRNLMQLAGAKGLMGALVILALLQSGCVIGQALFLSSAISLLWEGSALAAAVPTASAFAACFALLYLLRFAQDTLLDRFASKTAHDLNGELVAAALDPDAMLARDSGAAAVATAATDGIDKIEAYLRIIPPKIIGMAVISIPVLVCVFALDWPSGIILAVMFPVIMFFMVLIGKQSRARSERQYAAYTRLNNRFMDTLRGMRTIKALGAQKHEEENVYNSSEDLREATLRTLTAATLSSAVLDLCATFGVAAVAMMLAFRLMDGSITLFTGLSALILAPEFFTPIRAFASDYHASLDGKNALANHLELMKRAAEMCIKPRGGLTAHPSEPSGGAEARSHPVSSWTDDSVLSFEHIGFSYDQTGNGVRDISFEVHAGEKIAVVGPSGSGKSTLASLIAGFSSPDSGAVLIDGTPVDLSDAAWRRHVRSIPQSPYIFRATLEENMRFYNPAATREEVLAAACAVGLDDLISSLPDGLDTLAGDGARGLSGGEAHRVALARILLDDDARILVFDEPTAHLDIETELELKESMLKLMEGKLCFIATHRMHWLDDVDGVIALKAGRLAPAPEKPSGAILTSDGPIEPETPCPSGERHPSTLTIGTLEKACSSADMSDASAGVGEGAAAVKRSASGKRVRQKDAEEGEDKGERRSWLSSHVRAYRRDMAFALLLGFTASGCAALLMFTSGYLISATALAATTLFSVMVPIACVQLFGFGRPLARYVERLASHNWVLKVTSELRLSLFRAIERRTGDPESDRACGEYLGLMADDVAHLQNLYLRVAFPTIIAYLLAIAASILYGLFSWSLALIMALSFAIIALALPFGSLAATRTLIRAAKSLESSYYVSVADDVMGAADWVLAGRSAEALGDLSSHDLQMRALTSRIRLRQRAFSLVVFLLCCALALFLLLWAGNALGAESASANWIAALALGFLPLVEGFAALPVSFAEWTVHEEALARLGELISPDDTPQDDREVASKHDEHVSGDIAVSIQNLTYAYPAAEHPALDQIDIALKRNTATAILGRSGAGKSTLANLMGGSLKPDRGTVRLEGQTPSPATIGVLGQTPYLFNRTLRDNLLIGTNRTDEELVSLLISVGLSEAFAALPDGLDTIVGETGVGFSGGEAHRIALARILATDAPIVLVDEPFSALDPETERALLDTLLSVCSDRTLVVITHHLAEIMRFDRVVFIENGRIDLDGSPSDLLATSQRFRHLASADRNL